MTKSLRKVWGQFENNRLVVGSMNSLTEEEIVRATNKISMVTFDVMTQPIVTLQYDGQLPIIGKPNDTTCDGNEYPTCGCTLDLRCTN